jgi:two-component system LytT family response regulator
MGKLKIAILEDDTTASFVLENLINKAYSNVFDIVGVATTISSGIKLILEHSPDLVFLDLYLADKDGFDLFKNLKIINFETIITTVDKSKAIDAIKVQALDYLIKPVTIEDFDNSIKKFFAKRIKTTQIEPERVRITTPNGLINVAIADIIFLEANGNFTTINYANRISQQISRPMKALEELLVPLGFFRVQKSFLVNLPQIIEYSKSEGGYVVMKNYEDKRVPVSKFVRDKLLDIF